MDSPDAKWLWSFDQKDRIGRLCDLIRLFGFLKKNKNKVLSNQVCLDIERPRDNISWQFSEDSPLGIAALFRATLIAAGTSCPERPPGLYQ